MRVGCRAALSHSRTLALSHSRTLALPYSRTLALSYYPALASDFLRPLNYVVHAAHLAEPCRDRRYPAVPRSRAARRTGGHGRGVGALRRRRIRRRRAAAVVR